MGVDDKFLETHLQLRITEQQRIKDLRKACREKGVDAVVKAAPLPEMGSTKISKEKFMQVMLRLDANFTPESVERAYVQAYGNKDPISYDDLMKWLYPAQFGYPTPP